MIKKELKITNDMGLHARPAAIFIQHANKYKSNILISKENSTVNAKSIMGVMALSVGNGDEIVLKADGEDEKEAMDDLMNLLEEGLAKLS
ncbi:HPr family phosphocarrier protein [Criibacterium bergeronii]|uniref:Phosphocarrier protein HPr n=1 Tax=Criibacterium bergeronii TaxID=1871336 RepID=A0A371IMG3_9FIRM|nr:HPr family phosphocarrier protein [Criibacterium bergeronii]MBS6062333.1 HPr family phosphocarrier protein [Peptostreptococcaceae bacterium]RDY21682.1 HPr family phosphocarrier protein [Criibacterium bergeronii]TRW28590.1 HPr family phosphocarrier protein [Criibacterium bergeronii]